MKAFGYVRVSGKGQVDGDGFERQEQAIREYAEKHEITIEHIFREEGVSGTTEVREALAEMMVSLEQNGHGIKTVIVEKLDRLSRELMVQESIIRDFKKNDIDLISAMEGADLISNDPSRQFIRQIFGAVAEYEKNITVLKLRAARERIRARTGKCEGRKFFLDSREGQEVLKEIKRLRRKKKGTTKVMSYSEIAEVLNEKGYKTYLGKPFTEKAIQNILQNAKTVNLK